MTELDLKKRIMRRIYAIWFVRRASPMLLGVGAAGYLALRETARQFFVAKIVSNFMAVASSSVWSVPSFIASALNHAQPTVLILISAAGLTSFYLAIKLLRSIRSIVSSGRGAPVAYFQKF